MYYVFNLALPDGGGVERAKYTKPSNWIECEGGALEYQFNVYTVLCLMEKGAKRGEETNSSTQIDGEERCDGPR